MIENKISEYIGIPYIQGGRNREGLDCWGFFCLFYKEVLQINLRDFKTTDSGYRGKYIEYRNGKEWDQWVKIKSPHDCCAVVMGSINEPYHIGIYYKGLIVHCLEKLGVIAINESRLILLKLHILEYYLHEKQAQSNT